MHPSPSGGGRVGALSFPPPLSGYITGGQMSSGCLLNEGGPRPSFVKGSVVAQTGVQTGDEFVGDDAQGLVVELAATPELVIALSCSGRVADRRVGPEIGRIGEPSITPHPPVDFSVFAGGAGDRDVAGIAAACRSIRIAGRIVAGLPQKPAAEDVCQTWKAAIDLGVRVTSKSP